MNTLFLETPGKINLYLEVKGKMASGYHEILTLFYPVSLCDQVTLQFNDSGRISCSCTEPSVPVDERNLAVRGAMLYYQAAGLTCPGLEIRIIKRLPVAGGMGSGSSDAGAVLRLLQQHCNGALEDAVLKRIALEIGSDVPFFLNAVPSMGGGRGEELSPVEKVSAFSLPLLLLPGSFPVSAAWAYGHWRESVTEPVPGSETPEELIRALQEKDFERAGTLLRNDLACCVLEKFPLLRILEREVRETSGHVLLSGSGPTLFALYKDFAARDRAWEYLRGKNIHAVKTS